MYENRCYEMSTAVEANGTVTGWSNERLDCFHLMKCVLYLLIRTEMRGSELLVRMDRPLRRADREENYTLPFLSEKKKK